jgi:N-acetylglucosamine kinase-like BadF-type ATPase
MKRIGYKAKVLVVNDALVALEAGAPSAPGVVLIAGTGSIAYGRNEHNQSARAGGWGYMLGDEGSGYWIGRAALRACLREADRRGPATQLTGLLLHYYGVARAQDLIAQVYHGNLRPAAIAALAQCVQGAFSDGDGVAIGILRSAADQLESAALSVARRLELNRIGFPICAVRRHLPRRSVVGRRARQAAADGIAARADDPSQRRARQRRRPPRARRSAGRLRRAGVQN